MENQSPNPIEPISEKIVIFCFAGRQKYLDIQIKFILKILEQNINVEYHLWNFCRNDSDNQYLQTLKTLHDRITIFNQFYQGDNRQTICIKHPGVMCDCIKCRLGVFSEAYTHYANVMYKNTTFIKLDDDILYLSVDKINDYVKLINKNPENIIVPNIINNGVCAYYNDELKQRVFDCSILNRDASLHDFWYLCTSKSFFNLSHDYFIEKYGKYALHYNDTLIKIDKTRFSINTLGISYNIMKKLSEIFKDGPSVHDEGNISANFSFLLYSGFITSHFHFSDQRILITDKEENEYLKIYDNISIDCTKHIPKVCFITAIYGNYESTCKQFATQTIPTDFICFTDNHNIVSNGWIIDSTPYHILNPSPVDNQGYINSISNNRHTFNIAKYYKQAFQNIPRLKDYDAVIWLDGTIQIIDCKCSEWILSNIHNYKIIGWNYGFRNGSLKHEVKDSDFYRYTSTFWNNQPQPYQDIFKQYDTYLNDGYTDIGVWVTCFVAFDNKNRNISAFLDTWYSQTLTYTTQDQIGFPYTCYKHNIMPYTLPNEDIYGPSPQTSTQFYIKHNHGI